MMNQQMRTPKVGGGMMMSKGKANIADMEKACSAMAGKNASMRY